MKVFMEGQFVIRADMLIEPDYGVVVYTCSDEVDVAWFRGPTAIETINEEELDHIDREEFIEKWEMDKMYP